MQSKATTRVGRPPTPLVDRFWPKVNKSGPVIRPELGPCWVWTASVTKGGYGRITGSDPAERNLFAHRVSWRLHFGAIPDGLRVLHHCDNPPCVRPDHLFLGTNADNSADMVTKGRSAPQHGTLNPQSKLTDAQVVAIRERYSTGLVSQDEIAAELGISQVGVSHVIRGDRWTHLTADIVPHKRTRATPKIGLRLTREQVLEIRAACDTRSATQAEIARQYGISQALVSQIGRRIAWSRL